MTVVQGTLADATASQLEFRAPPFRDLVIPGRVGHRPPEVGIAETIRSRNTRRLLVRWEISETTGARFLTHGLSAAGPANPPREGSIRGAERSSVAWERSVGVKDLSSASR